MIEFFKSAWGIEMQRFQLFLDYWYVWVGMMIIAGICIWKCR